LGFVFSPLKNISAPHPVLLEEASLARPGRTMHIFQNPSSIWLVVWNINFIFPYTGNVIIPIDELIFFRWIETTNQSMLFRVEKLKPPTDRLDEF